MAEPSITQILLDELRTLDRKIDGLGEDISDLKSQVARLETMESQQEKDIISFWAENWGPLKSDITDIKNRLGSLESKDVKNLENRIDELEKYKASAEEKLRVVQDSNLAERLTKLEKADIKKMGIAAGVGLASGGGITTLLELFLGG